MSDIVERLRRPDESNDENICQLLDDAADEIERLRNALQEIAQADCTRTGKYDMSCLHCIAREALGDD